jgi:hypothetical protein
MDRAAFAFIDREGCTFGEPVSAAVFALRHFMPYSSNSRELSEKQPFSEVGSKITSNLRSTSPTAAGGVYNFPKNMIFSSIVTESDSQYRAKHEMSTYLAAQLSTTRHVRNNAVKGSAQTG